MRVALAALAMLLVLGPAAATKEGVTAQLIVSPPIEAQRGRANALLRA
jgi:hypothetical protein